MTNKLHKKVTEEVKEILLKCGLKDNVLYNGWNLDDIVGLIEANYEILFSDTHYNAERMY